MKAVMERTFTSQLYTEYSSSSQVVPLGEHEQTMQLFLWDELGRGMIEWDMPGIGETQHIGLWWDPAKMVLEDYDGVFSLPSEAAQLIEEYGITVGEEFR